ncbi:hypothetical protein [Brucella vulpis]|uniref:hypothetical protein n=1 Tax=Brucella vulpis TaxID=981386 RepID=UPI0009E4366B
MKNPSIFGSSQKRGVLIPICSRFESVTFRESEAILTLPEVCQQSEGPFRPLTHFRFLLLMQSRSWCTGLPRDSATDRRAEWHRRFPV